MKTLVSLTLSICLSISIFSQAPCLDPDTTFITDCGTEIDLCMDEFVTEMGVGIALNITANDDLSILDPHDCDTVCGTKNGSLTRMACGNWFYLPDPGFCGCDSFLYLLNWRDTCAGICYCEPGCPDGRIWTINSMYLHEEPGDVFVYSKTDDLMAEFYGLQQYDMFFVDGSSYPHSNINWTYTLYRDGVRVGKEIIHTSCSEEIFGKTYDFLRPISGCLASPNEGPTCAGVGNSSSGGPVSRYPGVPITVEGTDTTLVVIEVEAPLAEVKISFDVKAETGSVMLRGELSNVEDIRWFEIQRSNDQSDFSTIYKSDGSSVHKTWQYCDPEPEEGKIYYRVKITDIDGIVWYSNIKTIVWQGDTTWLRIHPNPGNGNFNVIARPGHDAISWEIYASSGRKVHLCDHYTSIDVFRDKLNSLNTGVFYIQIKNSCGELATSKLIVL